MATNGLSAGEHRLGEVFSSDFDFSIPNYQRPYRWGVEQAEQLLDDLEESLEHSGDDEYFLGSLVLIEHGQREFDVVDGQQRLTTLTILFAVLRDLADDPEERLQLRDLVYEPGQSLRDIPPKVRLTVRTDVQPFFLKYVQQPGGVPDLLSATDNVVSLEPMRAIRDNARAFHRRISTWSSEKRNALAKFMLTKTFLVTVATPSLPSAHRIFSVMNSRGLDLAPTDIFKAQVIGALDDSRSISQRWQDAEDLLGAESFTELFRDIRTVENGLRARRELLQEFPEQVLNPYLERGDAVGFVDEILDPYAGAFAKTVHADFGPGPEWRAVNAWLKRLALIDNKDWRPLALWAMKSHPDDPLFLEAFLRRLERLAASFLLRGVYTTPRIQRYLEVLEEVKSGVGPTAPRLELDEEERRLTREAIDGDIYRMQVRRARYVLLRLDGLLLKGGGAEYETKLIQIEHVLPQKASDRYWLDRFSQEDQIEWTNRLGNLLLLNDRANRRAQNFPFPRKRDEYFSRGAVIFQIAAEVINEKEWTLDLLRARQERLVGLLTSEWDLE